MYFVVFFIFVLFVHTYSLSFFCHSGEWTYLYVLLINTNEATDVSQKPYILLLCFFIFMWPLICQTAVQPWLKVLSEVGLHRKFTIRTFPHSSPNFYMGMKNPEYGLNFRPQSPLCHSRFKLEQHVWNLEHSWSTDDLPTVHTWYSLAYTPLRKWGYEIPRPPPWKMG